ncbi:MAG: hypothetical protein KGQ66_04760 [Acidobacteriota bacterium]|nr:hypothetical protein [Acidobacteriota bacterium]
MPEVVVGRCHGGWDASDGFVVIPDGTHLFLFQDPGESMDPDVADEGALSTKDRLIANQSSATWHLEPGDIAYNYLTQTLRESDFASESVWSGPAAQDVEIVGGDMMLFDVLQQYKGNNIYWFACQAYAAANPGQELEDMAKAEEEGTLKRP